MNPSNSSPRYVEQLLQGLEDCSLTGAEHAELMDLLRNDSKIRARYLEHMEFAGLLHAKAEAIAILDEHHFDYQETSTPRVFIRSALAAAAVIALCAYLATMVVPSKPEPASLSESSSAVWSYENGGLSSEGTFTPGTTISLASGALDLRLSSGTTILLEGPAKLEIKSPSHVYMPTGRLWARAEQGDFVVSTDKLTIVDLGTEFGVIASGQVDEEVHVGSGKVRVVPKASALSPRNLLAGEAVRANTIGRLRVTSYQAEKFSTTLPTHPPYLHWSFDSIVDNSFPVREFGLEGAPFHIYSYGERSTPHQAKTTSGRFGQAISLAHPEQFAQADYLGISGNLPRTISFWIKDTKKEDEPKSVFVCWGNCTDRGTKWTVGANNKGNSLTTNWGDSWLISPHYTKPKTNIWDGSWHHLAYVFTGRYHENGAPELFHYLDGVPIKMPMRAANIPVDTDCDARNAWPLTLGTQLFSTSKGPSYNGALDELHIFRGALSPNQIRDLYQKNLLSTSAVQK